MKLLDIILENEDEKMKLLKKAKAVFNFHRKGTFSVNPGFDYGTIISYEFSPIVEFEFKTYDGMNFVVIKPKNVVCRDIENKSLITSGLALDELGNIFNKYRNLFLQMKHKDVKGDLA